MALSLAALLIGCGKKPEVVYPCTNLGGRITLDTIPIQDGMIAFGSTNPKVGQIVVTKIVRGRYIAEKVPLGPVRVFISAFKFTDPGHTRVSLIPPKYQVGIELKVTRNSSRVDFKLDSTEPPAAPVADAGAAGDEAAPGADPASDGTKPKPDLEPETKSEPEPEPVPPGVEEVPGLNWG